MLVIARQFRRPFIARNTEIGIVDTYEIAARPA
jgi:hypothetical protein